MLESSQASTEQARAGEGFRIALEAVPNAIIMIDGAGKIIFANSQMEKLFGYARDEFIGQAVEMLMPERFRQRYSDYRASFFFSPQARSVGAGRDLYGLHRDGREIPIEIGLSPVTTEEGAFLIASITDITERQRAQEALFKLASIVESSDDAIISKTLDGIITSWNGGAERLYGYAAEEVIGRPLSIIIPRDHLDELPELLEKIRRGESVEHYETLRVRKDGRLLDISLTVSPIRNANGEIVGASAVGRDITERKRDEKDLWESSRNFQALDNATTQAVWTADERGGSDGIAYWWQDLTGQNLAELKELEWLEAVHPDDRERTRAAWAFALEHKTPLDIEYRVKTFSGEYLHFAVRGAPVFNDDGTFRRWIGTFTNITERKQAEERLRESEGKLRLFVEYAPAAVAMFDSEMRYLAVSRRWIQDYQISGDVIGRSHYEVFPDSSERWKQIHQRCLAGVIEKSDGEQFIHDDGSVSWLKWEAHPWLDAAGAVGGIIIFSEDITEQKHAEAHRAHLTAQIESQRQRLNSIIDSVPGNVWEQWIEQDSAAQRVNFTSDYFETMTGYSANEWLAEPGFWLRIVHPEDQERVGQTIAQGLASGQSGVLEFRWIAKDGRAVWVEARTVIVKDEEGRPIGMRGVTMDITERKSLEAQLQQAQKMEAIGQLAGSVAHDFNNLLTAINGYSDLAMWKLQAGDPLRHNLEEIKKAGERAASLTRQLLAFSRKQVLQPKVLDLNDIIADLEKMLRRLIGEEVELRTALEPEIGRVKADPGQIEQVIMNLVVNARDAMPGGGKMMIETGNVYLDNDYAKNHVMAAPGPHVMLAVSDNGMGMTPETQARIFEPFFTTKEAGKGTGLGLSTVYGIVKQSGGNIWVYSEVGRGTTFKVYLPRVDERAQEYKRSGVAREILRGKETILLVEDEELVRTLARAILESCGYRVLEASGGGAALLLGEQHAGPIDLLLTDVVMPEMSGRALAARLAQLRPEMKVLYMSGYTDDAIIHQGVLEEGTNFVEKPFAPEAIARKVREALDKP